uniref:Riboflavin kinase n=1 Tax=Lates calcarifer TaxID=8187 RepID=A0A4W6GCN3_LATCA
MKSLPFFCRGEVIRGFGRGSKELGIPTANFPDTVVDSLPADISTGIYYGWACVGNGDVHKMVMSIGWNPYYKNTKKSMETHVIHKFKEDFYGEILSVVMVGYIRPERSYNSLGMTPPHTHTHIIFVCLVSKTSFSALPDFISQFFLFTYHVYSVPIISFFPSVLNSVTYTHSLTLLTCLSACFYLFLNRGSNCSHQQRH